MTQDWYENAKQALLVQHQRDMDALNRLAGLLQATGRMEPPAAGSLHGPANGKRPRGRPRKHAPSSAGSARVSLRDLVRATLKPDHGMTINELWQAIAAQGHKTILSTLRSALVGLLSAGEVRNIADASPPNPALYVLAPPSPQMP